MHSPSRNEARNKASVYAEKPLIPKLIQSRFPGWTHFEIRAFHKRITPSQNTIDGKKRRARSRYVTGYIFLHLAREDGHVHPKPVKSIFKEKMTRRDFAAYARELTMDMDNSLTHVFH
jgi:hypothetical protein